MTTIEIKKRIYDFVEKADSRKLNFLYQIIIKEDEAQSVPESLYQELDLEREKHIKTESPSFGWEEVRSRLKKSYGI